MSARATDLPPEAANALPLEEAFKTFSDPHLLKELNERRAFLKQEDVRADDNKHTALHIESLKMVNNLHTQFVAKLRRGELTAWLRRQSPLEPFTEVPPTAWNSLRLFEPELGFVSDPGGTPLFDVHVGPRAARPAPTTGDPGRPQKGYQLYEAEFERRKAEGRLRPRLRAEANELHDWYITKYPAMPRPTIKTIMNRLRKGHREAVDVSKTPTRPK